MAAWPYSTTDWQRVRKLKLAMNPICELRLKRCRLAATEVDHVRSIRNGGDAFALDNLQSLCKPCHGRKTRQVDEGGADKARDLDVNPETGRPLDGRHWWSTPRKSLAVERDGPSGADSSVVSFTPGKGGF